MMRLAELLSDSLAGAELDAASANLSIAGLSADSRRIEPGMAFFALPGTICHGLVFADSAKARGAVALVSDQAPDAPIAGMAFVKIPDIRRALALAAARFYGRQPATSVAITGTSGKTSVSVFLRQIWQALGHRAASLGTIGLVSPSSVSYGTLTTPDPVSLHQTLAALARDGVTHLALEASSHGLDQRRLDGLRLAAAGFTNLSRDHLDYHPDLESYLAAKLRLFEVLLPPAAPVVIDADSDVAERVMAVCRARGQQVFTVGRKGESLRHVDCGPRGLANQLTLAYAGQRTRVLLPLAGEFQVQNALVAAGLALATGEAPERVFAALEKLEGVPGRLERIGDYREAPIFVDYAHKPDALDKVLTTLRPLTAGRLIVVFGCGGNRDKGKRPIMGEVAGRLADFVIVTDDNPRNEDAAEIRREIIAGFPAGAAGRWQEIGDRGKAIAAAIAMLAPGDVLLVAGKGHETGQIVGDKVLPFSDQISIRAALRDLAA